MNTKLKKTLITITTTLFAILIVTTATYAIGTLTPSGTPGDDTQYSLNDIYTKLTVGTSASIGSGMMTVPSSVTATFRTLTEIYTAIPETLLLSESTTTIPVGINRATTTLTTIDADFVPGNIADGTSIFGVTGTLPTTGGVFYPTEWSSSMDSSSQGNVDWATAVSYCDLYTGNSYTDWRLPTYIELVNVYLTGLYMDAFLINAYWSSTSHPEDMGFAYIVNMGGGGGNSSFIIKTENRAVRCTR